MNGVKGLHRWVERVGARLLLMVLAGASAGCGARTEYALSDKWVHRIGWDTLRVEGVFLKRTMLGGVRMARPDTAMVHLFDATYDTLYAGPLPKDGHLPVPDAALGDRERILVEVCGRFGGHVLCGQESVRASPKRLRVQMEITYPLHDDYRQGRYALHVVAVERRRFSGAGWERIEAKAPPAGFMYVHVQNRRAGTLRIPLEGRSGVFNLANHDGYGDFAFYLQSAFFEDQAAAVTFDVYAGLGPKTRPVAHVSKTVRMKSRDERRAVVRHLARQAVEQIVDWLEAPGEGHEVLAYIDHWEYNRFRQRYRIELEIRWEGGGTFEDENIDEDRRLRGALEVEVPGTPAWFRRTGGNRSARRRWAEAVGGSALHLRSLETALPDSLRILPEDAVAEG